MWIAGWLWSQCNWNWPHLNLILSTPGNFSFLGWHQYSSGLVTLLLGTLWSSIKQIEAPYVFDWEKEIALGTMQGTRASYRREGKVSWIFWSCGRNLWYILELRRGCTFETGVCSLKSGHLSRYEGHIRNVNSEWQLNTDASGSSVGVQVSFSICHSDIGIPNYIKKLSGIVKIWSSELHVAF